MLNPSISRKIKKESLIPLNRRLVFHRKNYYHDNFVSAVNVRSTNTWKKFVEAWSCQIENTLYKFLNTF